MTDPKQPEQPPKDVRTDPMFKIEHNVRLTGLQIVVIFNLLNNQSYRPGDFAVIQGILDKLEPFMKIDTNITADSAKKQQDEAKLKVTNKSTN